LASHLTRKWLDSSGFLSHFCKFNLDVGSNSDGAPYFGCYARSYILARFNLDLPKGAIQLLCNQRRVELKMRYFIADEAMKMR
jgi:hypothetical protein